MKMHTFIKTVGYLVLCTVVVALSLTVPTEQAEADVSSYNLVDKKWGPVLGGKDHFNKYFVIEDGEIGNTGGYIDVSSRDTEGQVIARNRFNWKFSRDVSYLYPDPNNNLTVQLSVEGAATGGTNHFIKTYGKDVATEFVDNTKMQLADSWPTPNERVTANMGYRTHEFHVWEYAYFEYTAIGFMINLWSPVEGGKGGSFAVAYLYRDASVPAAQVTKLWPVNNAYCRGNVLLWAYTFNVGSTPLPSDAGVYFYVQGPGVDRWIDGVSVAGWNARSGAWCSLNWAIPNDASGSYYYFARVYSPTQGFLSPPPEQSDDWQAFIVSCP